MNDILDVLIAFIGFLILFSMLVTSVQDALKNALKLKAKVWERFFIGIYEKELSLTPKMDKKKIVDKKKRTFIGEFDKRLSRLKEILKDADELLKALKKTLNDIVNADIDDAEDKEAFFQNLEKLFNSLNDLTGLNLKSLLDIYDKFIDNHIGAFYSEIERLQKRFPELGSSVSQNIDLNIEAFKEECSAMLVVIQTFETNLSNYKIQIEKKADAWLEQLQREYKRNMLKWTLIIGAVFVLIFNADSFTIFKYLMHNAEPRNALIKEASEIVNVQQKSNAENLNEIQEKIVGNNHKGARETIKTLLETMLADYKTIGNKDKAKEIEALKKKVTENDIEAIYNETILLYANLQKKMFDKNLENIKSIDLPLGWVGEGKKYESYKESKNLKCWAPALFFCKKMGGLALTWLLTTFGAPFWKDVLNALVGIKKTAFKKS